MGMGGWMGEIMDMSMKSAEGELDLRDASLFNHCSVTVVFSTDIPEAHWGIRVIALLHIKHIMQILLASNTK